MNTKIKDPLEGALRRTETREGIFGDATLYKTTLHIECAVVATDEAQAYSVTDQVLFSKSRRESLIRGRIYGDLSRRYQEVRTLQRDLHFYRASPLEGDLTRLEETLESRMSDFEEALRICMEGSSDG